MLRTTSSAFVAIPDMCCRKLSAVRSPVRMLPRRPLDLGNEVALMDASAVGDFGSETHHGVKNTEQTLQDSCTADDAGCLGDKDAL